MGLSEIKVILETLQRACTEAENDGKRDIVSVLSKPEVCLPCKLSDQT
jgi:hypothetical protein